MLDLINETDFKERFEELKDEYARKHGFYGENDEFASTWWENDENLHDAEGYAYDILSKEMFEFSFNDFGKLLVGKMEIVHKAEIERIGHFEGTELCYPHINSLETAAAWYLFTYDNDALRVLHEHANVGPKGYDDDSCFGFKFRDVRNFILEKCTIKEMSLEDKIKQAAFVKATPVSDDRNRNSIER